METKYENYEDMLEAAREEYLAKVPEGMKEVATGQIDMVLDGIREMAEKNTAFADKLLLPWKSFEKCYNYMEKKAFKMSTNKKTCVVVSTLLFDWINEYYMLDDRAEWEEKQKKKEQEEAALQYDPFGQMQQKQNPADPNQGNQGGGVDEE